MRPVYLPASLDELWLCLDDHPDAVVFAGGTDLFVKMRAGKREAGALIGLERIVALKDIREERDGIRIGAGVVHEDLLRHPLIAGQLPVLGRALACLGSPPIRAMGTIGGNICTASPAGDTLPPLYCLKARIELQSASGVRRLPIADFIAGPGTVRLAAGEIVTAVLIDRPPEDAVQHFEKVGRRKSMACAVASLAALVTLSPSGTVETCRLAWGSVGPTVVTGGPVEDFLTGKRLSRETLAAAAGLAARRVSPIDDVRASAAYRRTVAGNLLLRLSGSAADPGHREINAPAPRGTGRRTSGA